MSKVEVKRTIANEIEEKKGRLQLIESDKKAYRENLDDALNDCHKRIQDLRKENTRLRKQLFERLKSDEHVINEAFQRNPCDRAMFGKKSCSDALENLNYMVFSKVKQLNLLKYLTEIKCMKLKNKENEYVNLNNEINYVNDIIAGVNKCGQELRNLENRLDKATLKYSEAIQINKVYEQIINKLQTEHLHYGNTLDALENEISQSKKDLCNLKVMQTDAEMARDAAINEQCIKEDIVHQERKRREKELSYMKQVAENTQGNIEKLEKKIPTRDSIINEDLEISGFIDQMNEDQENKIKKFNECYKQIQEVSGVLNLQEAVTRFKNQINTETHLIKIIEDLEKQDIKFQREKVKFNNKLYNNKYYNETKEFNDEEAISSITNDSKLKEIQNNEIKNKLSEVNVTLALCKLSAEHINEIFPESESSSTNEIIQKYDFKEFIVDLFKKLEIKATNLMHEMIQIKDINYYKKLCFPPILETYNEFFTNVVKNISINNTRIIIPNNLKNQIDDAGHESGEDDNTVPTRRQLKKRAFMFVEAKTKKISKKKKKNKEK